MTASVATQSLQIQAGRERGPDPLWGGAPAANEAQDHVILGYD